MAQENNNRVPEIIAVVIVLLLLWRLFRNKPKSFEGQSQADRDAEKIKTQFSGDPDFNLNDYCQKVVYKPLSTNDLRPEQLMGSGWCSRGDRSIIDEDKGFGDDYADKQAQEYIAMKQAEAIMINNKLCIQFRLINTGSAPITTSILDTTQDIGVFDGSYEGGGPVPPAPQSDPASGINDGGFTANWQAHPAAIGYLLDVATDSGFMSFVPGYNNLDVGNVLSEVIINLEANTNYYYRVRYYTASMSISPNSAIIAVITDPVTDIDGNVYSTVRIGNKEFIQENLAVTKYANGTPIPNLTNVSDWFLPSYNELTQMYNELHLYGVGGFTNGFYVSSSEYTGTPTLAMVIDFTDGNNYQTSKGLANRVRACRSFVSVTPTYNLRDLGPAGGRIFYINGTTYYEASPNDVSAAKAFSNIITAIGTTSYAIGAGVTNTAAIIGQVGHTTSAALICTTYNAWITDSTGGYAWYQDNIANKSPYGALYSWYAVSNANALAPATFRVNTDADWDDLSLAAGG